MDVLNKDCVFNIMEYLQPATLIKFALVCRRLNNFCLPEFWVKQIIKYHGFGFDDYKRIYNVELEGSKLEGSKLEGSKNPPIKIKDEYLKCYRNDNFMFVYVHPFSREEVVELIGNIKKKEFLTLQRYQHDILTLVSLGNKKLETPGWYMVKTTKNFKSLNDHAPSLRLPIISFLLFKKPGFCVEDKIMSLQTISISKYCS